MENVHLNLQNVVEWEKSGTKWLRGSVNENENPIHL